MLSPGRPAMHDGIVKQVVEVHRERILGLRAELERDRRARRRDEHVELLERGVVLALDHGAYPLRLRVVRVVVAGRERVRAQHDAPLRLVAEAGVARLHHHLAEVVAEIAQPVADTVVAREVRRRLRRRDEVVAGEAVLDRARQRALPHLRAERLASSIALRTASRTPARFPLRR